MRRRELSLQKKIVAAIHSLGGKARILHQERYTTVGDSDVYGCLRGRMLIFEVKEKGEAPTRIQTKRLREWKEAGALTAVVCSVGEVNRILGGNNV